MKKTFLFLLSTLLFTASIIAQNTSGVTTQKTTIKTTEKTSIIGLKGGLNIANIIGDDVSDNSSLIGFNFGGFATLKQSENFAIQPEIMISRQGFTSKNRGDEIRLKNTYLNIPIILKFYVPESDGFNFQVGPQVGFLLSSKMSTDINGNTTDIDAKEIHDDMDFSLAFGLGFGSDKISFNARYNLGVSQIFDTGSSEDVDVKNGVVQFSLGIPIN